MIELTVTKITNEDGATVYSLTPTKIEIGNQDADRIDDLHFNLPEEFQSLIRRVTFQPMIEGNPVERYLDDTNTVSIDGAITVRQGKLTLDAYNDDIRLATTNVFYVVRPHVPLGGDPEYQDHNIIEKSVVEVRDALIKANDDVTASRKYADKAAEQASIAEQIVSQYKQQKTDTTANWNSIPDFIPLKGEIIVYSDYAEKDGKLIPNVKIGDGLAYLIDLPFIGTADSEEMMDHIKNWTIHVSTNDRSSWSNKVSCDLDGEVLILSI